MRTATLAILAATATSFKVVGDRTLVGILAPMNPAEPGGYLVLSLAPIAPGIPDAILTVPQPGVVMGIQIKLRNQLIYFYSDSSGYITLFFS